MLNPSRQRLRASSLQSKADTLDKSSIQADLKTLAGDVSDDPEGQSHLRQHVLDAIKSGLTVASDVAYLLDNALAGEDQAKLLLDAITAARHPSCFEFDLSENGHASIEFASLPKPFPPRGSSNGYTFMAWVKITSFDPASHTTIFGVFDESQTCFLLLYLERDRRQLVLQTSLSNSRPAVRFKKVTLHSGTWHHVALLHHRPLSAEAPSQVSVLLNGEVVEHHQCHYPRAAPRRSPVQAFFGTPQAIAPQLGPGKSSSAWSLASSHLFADVLSPDLIYIYQNLGPTYQGNFQDALGSFHTFEASANLNLRVEQLHPDEKDSRSVIVRQVRSDARRANPEGTILLSVFPNACLGHSAGSLLLTAGLSQHAFGTLQQRSNNGANVLVMNAATPFIPGALIEDIDIGVTTGSATAQKHIQFASTIWRESGLMIRILQLLQSAVTPQHLVTNLKVCIALINEGWRSNEVMERENGFGIIAWVLSKKLTALSSRHGIQTQTSEDETKSICETLLGIILTFIGYNEKSPSSSTMVNALAYRHLVVDNPMWRGTDAGTQGLFYRQMSSFFVDNVYERFNTTRLSRMRLVKKIIEIIKEHGVHREALAPMTGAFRCLLRSLPTSDNYRSVAMFVTFALRQTSKSPRRPASAISLDRHRSEPKAPSPLLTGLEHDIVVGPPLAIVVLKELTHCLDSKHDGPITKFATSVTNKWLLDLLSSEFDDVTIATLRILTRMFSTLGLPYIQRFDVKTQGFVVLQTVLSRKSHLPQAWTLCFMMLFGTDDRHWNHQRLDHASLAAHLIKSRHAHVVCPAVFPSIAAMLEQILVATSRPDEPATRGVPQDHSHGETNRCPTQTQQELGSEAAHLMEILFHQSSDFREFMQRTQHKLVLHDNTYVIEMSFSREIIKALYSAPQSSTVSLEDETDLISSSLERIELSEAMSSSYLSQSDIQRPPFPRPRNSSFVVVRSSGASLDQISALRLPLSPIPRTPSQNLCVTAEKRVLQSLLCKSFADQILSIREFTGLGLFLKAPSSPLHHRASIASNLVHGVLQSLARQLDKSPELYLEPRVLTHLARFISQSCEALYEGWLLGVESHLLAFAGSVLHYLDMPSIRNNKSVRLCSPQLNVIRKETFEIALFNLLSDESSEAETRPDDAIICLMAMQDLLLPSDNAYLAHFRALCSLLYRQLWSSDSSVRAHALSLWRSFLAQKQDHVVEVLVKSPGLNEAARSWGRRFFESLQDSAEFEKWMQPHKAEIDNFFSVGPDKDLFEILQDCSRRSDVTAKARIKKRNERLEKWHLQELQIHHTVTEHDGSSNVMTSNICESEMLKIFRSRQDQQESAAFLESLYVNQQERWQLLQDVYGTTKINWQLDESEGRDRMRMRLIPTNASVEPSYQPKRRNTIKAGPSRASAPQAPVSKAPNTMPQGSSAAFGASEFGADTLQPPADTPITRSASMASAEGFEVVPRQKNETSDEIEEDKNRKVMRSLQRGEVVEDACNVSIIYGLEAIETLLIVGASSLYLVENLFQRRDGEVVNAADAPIEERDPYTKTVSGQKVDAIRQSNKDAAKTRHWRWQDVVSISQRRFLFRDVGLEMFFKDGRSYLLTTATNAIRDDLYAKLELKVQERKESEQQPAAESLWRTTLSQATKPGSLSFGSKVASVFGSSSHKSATRAWARGEMSNFQYLMLVNTLAGRTFNDLTQYPVFPWVIADYTSEELDLTNPRTFRDLSKPMGCQSPQREAAFRERFKSFAEMDDSTPAFHYGTHYSSAMIVTSYLIRLQPFVKSYLLLQGGTFDHAERLFHSIEKAWTSASKESNSDVRELTPEFYYLPDFLVNVNRYNFGVREGSGEVINHVKLPPWAKGDPAIFITKQREALESPHVSQNLHSWIDLIFGFKQRGEAALEATNVFHYLTYEGARNIDEIADEHERIATIGIIHNFGQTPKQVFNRPHDQRDDATSKPPSIINQLSSLRRTAAPLSETREQVRHIQWSAKDQKIVPYNPFTIPFRSNAERIVRWGFSDQSIRFYTGDREKLLHIFEQPHEDQVVALAFADAKTLITASNDTTLALWTVNNQVDSVDVQAKATLFGHRSRVTYLVVSSAFGTIVSASADGVVLSWDLNRLQIVRRIDTVDNLTCLEMSHTSGHVLICTSKAVRLYTLNGSLLLSRDVCSSKDGLITCASFYADANSAWQGAELLLTGHERGNVKIWRVGIGKTKSAEGTFWTLELVRTLDHDIRVSDTGVEPGAAVTCIYPRGNKLYVGGEDGKVFEWLSVR